MDWAHARVEQQRAEDGAVDVVDDVETGDGPITPRETASAAGDVEVGWRGKRVHEVHDDEHAGQFHD